MALKPETIARIQGILDGTIKVDTTPRPPADISKLSDESRNRILALLDEPLPATPVVQPIIDEEPTMQQADASELRDADSVIEALQRAGKGDYSAFRNQIALDIYTNGHYNGNWDATFDPAEYDEASTLETIRVIQEDEFDQHMDDADDLRDSDDFIGEVNNGYLMMA